ncbi:hypothetical protein TrLO_g6034 [Triparma laevis f. longispina]|uniref:DUF445 domain-containing protein n=1 Tax=Triparma laevis f. longispina TaxID=1714387 RepID=A0A9W7KZC8_9STRA|nr:hypothetical protein TrLO_g6034 [Triparma laevis f. longispina]
MDNMADLETGELSTPLLSNSRPIDPMSWNEEDTSNYFLGSRFADLAPKFDKVDGKELCFLTERQIVGIVGGARGCVLFNEIKALRKAAELESQRTLKKLKTKSLKSLAEPSEKEANQGSFPPLIYLPSLRFSIIMLFLITSVALLLTVGSDTLTTAVGTDLETIIAYGSIPIISLLFTYFHIWAALYMTFFPLAYVGIGPQIPGTNVGFPLGWQGIIPFKAEKMARMAVKLMTEQLIDVKTEFSKIDVTRVATEMDSVVLEKLQDVISSTFQRHQKEVWDLLPDDVRDELVVKGSEAGPEVVKRIMAEVKEDILSVFDIEEFVVSFMTSNKSLLNKVFIRCGWDELCFIRDCGAILGGFFGLLQMLLWIPLHPEEKDPFMQPGWQSLSVFLGFGLIVGSATNWLALKIIFEPVEPINICGIYSLQGLFLKRQKEISAVYGKITATEVLSARNIIKEMLHGPNSPTLKSLIRRHLEVGCDEFIGSAVRPLITAAIGDVVIKMRTEAVDTIMGSLDETMSVTENYLQEALDMEHTMSTRMGELPSAQFERLLHPVFEEDEWKLVVMGGVLGVVIGAVQAFFIN